MRKTCTKCDIEKPAADFHRRSGVKDGLQSKCKECVAKYRRDNISLYRAREASYRESNRQKLREYIKSHKRIRAGYYNAIEKARKVKKKRAMPLWLSPEQIAEINSIYEHARDCSIISGESYHVDHIIPLSGESICGLHVPWNLQVLPADINLRKSNSLQSSSVADYSADPERNAWGNYFPDRM